MTERHKYIENSKTKEKHIYRNIQYINKVWMKHIGINLKHSLIACLDYVRLFLPRESRNPSHLVYATRGFPPRFCPPLYYTSLHDINYNKSDLMCLMYLMQSTVLCSSLAYIYVSSNWILGIDSNCYYQFYYIYFCLS